MSGRKGDRTLDLPDELLLLVATYLCVPGQQGKVHYLGQWRRVCKRWEEIAGRELWLSVWQATSEELVHSASMRFAASLHGKGSPAKLLASGKVFRGQMKQAGVEACLELGLLPRSPPPWCRTAGEIEAALANTLKFCSFQVAAARVELQCSRGSVPVIESATVLASCIHLVVGGVLFLADSDPGTALRGLTRPMLCISLCWALYLASYCAYRFTLAKIHSIPEAAARLWNVHHSLLRHKATVSPVWVTRHLLTDPRVLGALAWTGCLFLSTYLWYCETGGDPYHHPLTVSRLLMSIFGPPTFAATLVAWQRSGGKVGLVAGCTVGVTILLISCLPCVLFIGLGVWATTLLLNIHRGYYRAPRTPTANLLAVSRRVGHCLIVSICVLCASWFTTLPYFHFMLVFSLAVLALWVATAVFIPLVARSRSLEVPMPITFLFMQGVLLLFGYSWKLSP